ncbi:protein-export chaperone SecB [Neobacillus sp. MM2021_6]|uniref:protein-export chaperone SecB n=1 Tax=Bacillaceae TaxID=186817 RepID=UPI001409D8AC|nr:MULTISPECIES: protein-export chaperone SecB [Bacillaceae]MBO0961010.1 protein-export chaperone SecB [Neobacillus sp. MM2021_6]NHC19078.1 hypothetical protein [Bacillus sp. MM2020_4]
MTESKELIDLPDPDDSISYQEFVSNIEIDSVNIRKLNMESVVAPNEIANLMKDGNRIEIDLEHEFKLEKKLEENNSFFALGIVQVAARVKDNVLFLIEVELVIEYDTSLSKQVIPDEIYNDFVQNNVPVNLWPYAREAIQSGTTRMGYPPLTIRPYRVLM